MSFPIEDFERAREMDQIYLQEKEQEMFVEWQMWEEQNVQPAEILKPVVYEVESDSLPF